jgi:hypothetical protein
MADTNDTRSQGVPFTPPRYPRGARGIKKPGLSGTPLTAEQDQALDTLKFIMRHELHVAVGKEDFLREAVNLLLIGYARLPREEWRRGVPLPGEK